MSYVIKISWYFANLYVFIHCNSLYVHFKVNNFSQYFLCIISLTFGIYGCFEESVVTLIVLYFCTMYLYMGFSLFVCLHKKFLNLWTGVSLHCAEFSPVIYFALLSTFSLYEILLDVCWFFYPTSISTYLSFLFIYVHY